MKNLLLKKDRNLILKTILLSLSVLFLVFFIRIDVHAANDGAEKAVLSEYSDFSWDINNYAYEVSGTERGSYYNTLITEIRFETSSKVSEGKDISDPNNDSIPIYINFDKGILTVSTAADKICINSAYRMFNGNYALKKITGLENCDFSKCREFGFMFGNCESLESLDLSGMDVSSAVSCENIFYDCFSLTKIKTFASKNLKYDLPAEMADEKGNRFYKGVSFSESKELCIDGWAYVTQFDPEKLTGSYTDYEYLYCYFEKGVRKGYDPSRPDWPGEEIYDEEEDAYYFLENSRYGARAEDKEITLPVTVDGKTQYRNVYYLSGGKRAQGWVYKSELADPDNNDFQYISRQYWYEDGIRQGYDPDDPTYRGKEIYDPDSDAWYWLDNIQKGAMACSKDVYQESLAGEWGDIVGEDGQKYGKWVRYDTAGHMVKGWQITDKGTYYFDPVYGTMAKGNARIGSDEFYFNRDTGILESKIKGEATGLLGNDGSDQRITLSSAPIDLSGAGSTESSVLSYASSTPNVVTFEGPGSTINVAYYNTTANCLVVRKVNLSGETVGSLSLEKRGESFGSIIQDEIGNYYAVWGNAAGEEDYDKITMIVSKYGADGTFLGELALKGSETYPAADKTWGTRFPFRAGNCNLAISRGVLGINYARQMYNGHQSNMIIYVNTSDMTRKEVGYSNGWPLTATAYTSHSFDERIIATSDGGFLVMNQGDAYPRGFMVSRIGADLEGEGTLTPFHFREGGNWAYGYNATYAQTGGIAELSDSYVMLGSSERTLSRDVKATAFQETRDMFVQFIRKDFDEYDLQNDFVVRGETRVAEGELRADYDRQASIFLSHNTIDYGIVWLTAYDNDHFAANPRIIKINGNRFAVIWEKRSISNNYVSLPETFYAEIDGKGQVVVEATRLNGVKIAGNDEPILVNGVIYWATNDSYGSRLNMVRTSLAGEGGETTEDTEITSETNGWAYIGGVSYWYENGVRQGYDPENPIYRGKEIYDPGTNAWYWLDNVQQGAKAVSKDVYQESLAGDWGDIVGSDGQRYGKWVRYDASGHMIKGWNTDTNGTYYFDPIYGTMAKGEALIDGMTYYFDESTGILK